MSIRSILPLGFGVLAVLFVAALMRQLVPAQIAAYREGRLRSSVEGIVLLLAAVAVAAKYCAALAHHAFAHEAQGNAMPAIARAWLVMFGTCCTVYLAAKAVRSLKS